MDFFDTQEHILERLRATDIPNVFEVGVPPGLILPTRQGYHLPYLLVSFGGLSPVAMRNQGIESSKWDLKWTNVAIECVGASQRDTRRVSAIVRERLEGYIPDPSWSELTETLSGDYAVKVPEYDLWPVRYATGIVFNGYANGEVTYE